MYIIGKEVKPSSDVAIDGFTSLPIIITQQDASHPLKESK
jgi:hypothetical protein